VRSDVSAGGSCGIGLAEQGWLKSTQERRCIAGGERFADQIALNRIALKTAQGSGLRRLLNALRDDLEAKAVAKGNDGLDDCRIARAAGHITDEGEVDLQGADLKPLQIRERGIAGAKVIHGDTDSRRTKLGEELPGLMRIAHHDALGDLDREQLGWNLGVVE